ncbi:MAG: eCIS core domain-containing protein [Iamia sp.]
MELRRHGDHWLWVGGPVPPGAAAITIGSVVSVRRRSAESTHLLAHEAEHVRQYRERGVAGFLVAYLRDYLRLRARFWPHWAAYRRLGLEVDAEWRARRPDLAVAPLRR